VPVSSMTENRSSTGGSARTVLVCGAAGLLGTEICRRLAHQGHRLIALARQNRQGLDQLRSELGSSVVAAELADLTQPDSVADLFRRLSDAGRLPDALVVSMYAPFEPRAVVDERPEVIERHLDTFLAHYLVCQGFMKARGERSDGSIVLVTGALSDRRFPGFSMVSAMKSALATFASVLSLEAGPVGTTVNCIAPGRIVPANDDHQVPQDAENDADPRMRLAAMSRKRMALATFPTADDVSDVVCFLMSQAARQVTGQTIFLAAGEPM